MAKLEFQASLKTRIVIFFLLASVIPIFIVAGLLYTQAGYYLKENLFSYLEGISGMKKQTLLIEINNRKYRVEREARSYYMLNPLSRIYDAAGEDKGAAKSELQKILENILGDGSAFEEVYVIDAAGKILISTKKENEGKDVKDEEYFAQGSRETYFQSVFLSPVTARLSLLVASPIKKQDEALLGILVGRINLDEFYKTISDVTGLGITGESYIGNKDDGKAVFLTPTRHNPTSALNIKIKFGDVKETALQNAVQGADGKGVVKDYRGKMVMASWSYIPDIKWGLVTKIDKEEFEKPMTKWSRSVFFLSLAIVVIVSVVAYIFAIRIVKPINLLASAAEQVSKGNMDIKINIGSKDEIGNLARSFERMLAALKFFKEEKEEKEEKERCQ